MTENPLPAMRAEFIDAMQTIRRLRITVGPKAYGNSMPEYLHEFWKDAHPEKTRIIVRPSSEQIARMEAVFEVVNETLCEEDRHQVYQWGRIQVSRHATIREFSAKLGMKEHEYRRQIDKIFQKLVDRWKVKPALRLSTNVEQPKESGQKTSRSDETRSKNGRITGHMAPDSRPEHLPESADHKRLIRRMLKFRPKENGAKPPDGSGLKA